VTARAWAALPTVYVVWGSTYLAIMVAIRTLPPLLMSSVRYLVAGAILYAFAARRGATRPSLRHWRSAVVAGAALLVVGNGGVAALVGPVGGAGIDAIGALGALVAAVSWAAGSLYARGAALPGDLLLGAAMQMLAAGALLAVVGAASGEAAQMHTPSLASLGALAYLVVVGSLVAYSSYVWLMRSAPTSIVSTYAFVNPAIAVALGAAFLGEPLTFRVLAASAAIVVSVALIVTAREPRARVPQPRLEPLREAA